MQKIDCLIDARWIVPVEPARTVLHEHSLAIDAGRIVALLPTVEARAAYEPVRQVRMDKHALIPGLVNLHTHAAMALMRGLADDLPLMNWLKDHIWPAEARHVSPDFVHDGTLLACAEMLRGGITCFNDMYFFPESAVRAAIASRMRAAIGIIIVESPTAYASDAEDYLAKGLATRDAFKDQALISFCMAPHAPYTVGDKTFERVVTIAEELDLPIHLHLHETREEIEQSLAQFKARPVERLRALGVLSPRLIAVHAVHTDDAELDTLARFGASVAHCPSSNLKLASGFAPVASMLARGINLGLGTDSAASNNRLDLFQEMRTAALLAKAVSGRADALPAHEALTAATLGGARALGLDSMIGSLKPGKAADLCAVAFDTPELAPCYDPVSHLVYVAGREQVSHVWVAGELVVANGQLTQAPQRDLDTRWLLWQNQLRTTDNRPETTA